MIARLAFLPLTVLCVAVAVAAAGAAPSPKPAVASASSYAVQVLVPDQPETVAAYAVAPGVDTAAVDSFVYPADGSAVRTGAASSSAAARQADTGSANAVTDALAVSLFNGEISADAVAARAKAGASQAITNGDVAGSRVERLVVLGSTVSPAANQRLPLADWGTLTVLEQTVAADPTAGSRGTRATVAGLHIRLTAAHGGLPAGTEIIIGSADASAGVALDAAGLRAGSSGEKKPVKPVKPNLNQNGRPLPRAPEPRKGLPGIPPPLIKDPPADVLPQLTAGGYVFPVYGSSSFASTFGAPRADVSYHHGNDIFAQLGTPLLAVAGGTVFSVGWNDIGGYRLWLRDRQGNQFYYAHLSAFSTLAVNGNEVRAGDVLGFMGRTGDAEGTPYHVHFEIHPVGLLPLGYDGAVDPYPYLLAWRRLSDISFAAGRGWAPPVPASARAPQPGAILLGSTDISRASGLDPASLRRALVAPVSSEGDGALIRSS